MSDVERFERAYALLEELFLEMGKLQSDGHYTNHVSRDPITHILNLIEAGQAFLLLEQDAINRILK